MKSVLLSLLIVLSILSGYCQGAQPGLKWKFQTNNAVIASPIIDEDAVYFSSLDKGLYAVDLKTGRQLWKFVTQAPNRSDVLISGQSLYFLSGEGILYCLNKKTAKVSWLFKTGGEKQYELFSFADHFRSSPVLDGENLYFGSGDHHVYAVNSKTGALVWRYETGNIVHTTPAIQNNNLLIGSFDGYFYNLNKTTGKLLWKFKSVGQRYFPLGEFMGSPAVNGNTVYVGSRDFNFYAINISKGVCNWNRYFLNGWSIATPVFYKNFVINGTSDDRVLVAMDTTSGGIAWRTNAQFNIFGSCLLADSTGFFGTLSGKLFAVNLNNGNILWTYETDSRKRTHDEYLTKDEQYTASALASINSDLASQVPMFYKMGGIFSKPAIKDKQLVFSSSDGAVYCLGLQ